MTINPFVQKVRATIKRHEMAKPGEGILVAVSGGADSVCLARVLQELGYRIGIAHVNHGLRGRGSDEDEHFVRDLAASLGVPFFLRRVVKDQLTGNLEAAGRVARLSFFRDLMRTEALGKVALAHSLDDRTETFLLHLLRGSGAGGLVSMKPVSEWRVRPLIEVTRAEIESHLSDLNQPWRTDPSNEDLRFARNRLRHETLPNLATHFNPRLAETLARTTRILSAEDEWMDQAARNWVESHFSRPDLVRPAGKFAIPDASPRLEVGGLANQPLGLVRRVLRVALQHAGSELLDVGFDHIEQVRSLLEHGKSGRIIELPGPIHVERSFDALVFRPAHTTPTSYEYELPIPGRVTVPEAGYEFHARVSEGPLRRLPDCSTRVQVNGESLGPYVKIRNWKNGDTYAPVGLGRSSLKALFQDMRIPRASRRRWPVFVARSSIVWVASFPVSHDFVPTAGSRKTIQFEACPATR